MIRKSISALLSGWLVVGVLFQIPAASADHHSPRQTVTLQVENMTCNLCTTTVRMALENIPGVVEARVMAGDNGEGLAKVVFDPSKTNVEALVQATTEAGYPSRRAEVLVT